VYRDTLIGIVLVVFAPSTVRPQAYLQWDAAARPTALGGAAAALADDASAAFFSPAGIVHLFGTHVQAGASLSTDEARFRTFGDDAFDREVNPTLDGSLFVTHRVAGQLTGGLGVSTPWGLAVDWEQPSAFVGRFRSVDSRLRSIQFNPVIAYGPIGPWSAAVGVDVLNAVFEWVRFEQDPVFSALGGTSPIALAETRLDADGTGVGWNVATMYRTSDRLAVGAQYRSEIDIDLSGLADFAIVAPAELRAIRLPGRDVTVGEIIDDRYVDQVMRSSLTFPPLGVVGVAYRPVDQLLVVADAQWVGWGRVDSLAVAFADTALGDAVPLLYEDAWTVRSGAEMEYKPGVFLRLGYAWHESPASLAAVSPLLPDAGRDSYSAGFGFQWAGTGIDLAYHLTVFDDREGVAFPGNESAADGIYEGAMHRFGISLSRQF
jgi:long-chain fatty acid transport protein